MGDTMNLEDLLERSFLRGMKGEGSHVDSDRVLDGLDWKLAGEKPGGAPDTILRIANHIIFWIGYGGSFFAGRKPTPPEHDKDSWPGPEAPSSAEEWDGVVRAYKASLAHATALVKERKFADPVMPGERAIRIDWLRVFEQHTSYHAGQIVQLRRMLGAWPPPGGGDTW
jgi:hypothetical protein